MTQEQMTALAAFILTAARAAVEEKAHPFFHGQREWLDERTKAHANFIKAFSVDVEVK